MVRGERSICQSSWGLPRGGFPNSIGLQSHRFLELAKCFPSVSSHKVGMRPAFLQPEMAGLGKAKGIVCGSESQDILINPLDAIKKWACSDHPIFLFVF